MRFFLLLLILFVLNSCAPKNNYTGKSIGNFNGKEFLIYPSIEIQILQKWNKLLLENSISGEISSLIIKNDIIQNNEKIVYITGVSKDKKVKIYRKLKTYNNSLFFDEEYPILSICFGCKDSYLIIAYENFACNSDTYDDNCGKISIVDN